MHFLRSRYFWLFIVAAFIGGGLYFLLRPAEAHETLVFSQDRFAAETEAAIRVVVQNHRSGNPIKGAKVEINLTDADGKSSELGRFKTDANGTLSESVRIPALPPGDYRLGITTRSRKGSDQFERGVTIYRPLRVLLSTDKPIYQPGQTIHLRALATNYIQGTPAQGEPLRFEIRNADGALVFREKRTASRFGIAASDFILADEVSLGSYEVRVYHGEEHSARQVEVKRYVLPRFKVELATDRSFYQPGQRIDGTLKANYFFGKPAAGASVVIRAFSLQEAEQEVARGAGTTNADGEFSFHIQLPGYFTGRPERGGNAFLELVAEVTDTAGQKGRAVMPLTVSSSGLVLEVLPESGSVVPGIKNDFIILVSYPDGRPAAAELTVNGMPHTTGDDGILVWTATPPRDFELNVIARDQRGATAKAKLSVTDGTGISPLLIRTDKAVYQVGDTAQIELHTTEKAKRIFFDVIRGRQTILTRSFPLEDGKAAFSLPLPPDLTGMVKFSAYVISPGGSNLGQTRSVFLSPARGLRVATHLDQDSPYRPGETARIQFLVTDSDDQPAPGALGISVIDESVLFVQESAQGLLKAFLDTESDIQEPRYQIQFRIPPLYALSDRKADHALVSAWLGTLGPAPSRRLNSLVEDGILHPTFMEELERMRLTGQLDFYRDHPQWGPMVELVEGADGSMYPIRAATGAQKVRERQQQRQAVLGLLGRVAIVLWFIAFFALPLIVAVSCGRSMRQSMDQNEWAAGDKPKANALFRTAKMYWTATAIHFLIPPGLFVAGMILAEALGFWRFEMPEPVLWGIALVQGIAALTIFSGILLGLPPPDESSSTLRRWLLTSAVFYLTIFAILQTLILLMARHWDEGILLLWLAQVSLALVLACIVRAAGTSWMERRGARWPQAPANFDGVTVITVIIVLVTLAWAFVPTVGRVRESARRTVAASNLRQVEQAFLIQENDRGGARAEAEGPDQPRVRRDFPETLLWQPELITDDEGRATLDLALADSITTWLGSYDVVDARGRLGQGEVRVPVFQSFFVDLDLPVELSLHDEIALPVVCYNYLDRAQTVRLQFEQQDWYEPLEGSREVEVRLDPGEVRAIHFPLRAVRVGEHPFLVRAIGEAESDAIERVIRVKPTGRQFETVHNADLADGMEWSTVFPQHAIPGSESLVLKLFPSRFSEVLEGMEGMLKVPSGCFEQTSSVNYPNVLALSYLEETGTLTPEIEARARKLINIGYQRLLTFQTKGGGFDWFGRSPANVWLTAYGVRQFTDMAKVHAVDPLIRQRAIEWIYGEQLRDGSWSGARFGSPIIVTAYTVWSLASAGERDGRVEAGADWLRRNRDQLNAPYEIALAANALLTVDSSDPTGRALVRELVASVQSGEQRGSFWKAGRSSIARSYGNAADIETTALAAMALLKDPATSALGIEAVSWISGQRTAWGSFGSTQATILSIEALLRAMSTAKQKEDTIHLSVSLNGRPVEDLAIAPEDYEVMRLISLTSQVKPGTNVVRLSSQSSSDLGVQLAASYWLSETTVEADPVDRESLAITVAYNRATLDVNDILTARVTIENRTGSPIPMPLIDLGIPPGFELQIDSIEELVTRARVIARYEVTGNQLILYLQELPPKQPFSLFYRLRAKHPLRVSSPLAAVYDYYNPNVRAETDGGELEVR